MAIELTPGLKPGVCNFVGLDVVVYANQTFCVVGCCSNYSNCSAVQGEATQTNPNSRAENTHCTKKGLYKQLP